MQRQKSTNIPRPVLITDDRATEQLCRCQFWVNIFGATFAAPGAFAAVFNRVK